MHPVHCLLCVRSFSTIIMQHSENMKFLESAKRTCYNTFGGRGLIYIVTVPYRTCVEERVGPLLLKPIFNAAV